MIKKLAKKVGMIFSLLKNSGFLTPAHAIRAYWCNEKEENNFGDMITPYLIKKVTGVTPIFVNQFCPKKFYLMTGSIISRSNNNAVVWGSGLKAYKTDFKKPKVTYAVRGPITRKRFLELGYPCPEVYGDPALLLPIIYSPQLGRKKYDLGIIPHVSDFHLVQKLLPDHFIINLQKPVEEVIDSISLCKKTISSSLHGIIVSHAYNIPSAWVSFSDNVTGDGVKFLDYFLSVDLKTKTPVSIESAFSTRDQIEKTIESIKFEKPKTETIRRVQKKLMDTFPIEMN